MKQKLLIAISCLVVLTGCGSSELSPAEKRNKFDKCVLDYVEEKYTSKGYAVESFMQEKGKLYCKDLLD